MDQTTGTQRPRREKSTGARRGMLTSLFSSLCFRRRSRDLNFPLSNVIPSQAKKMEFFRAMETNMKMNFKQGISHTPAGKMGLTIGLGTPQASTKSADDSGRAMPEWVDTKNLSAPAREVRTISTVDDLVLLRSQRLDTDDRVLAGSSAGRKVQIYHICSNRSFR